MSYGRWVGEHAIAWVRGREAVLPTWAASAPVQHQQCQLSLGRASLEQILVRHLLPLPLIYTYWEQAMAPLEVGGGNPVLLTIYPLPPRYISWCDAEQPNSYGQAGLPLPWQKLPAERDAGAPHTQCLGWVFHSPCPSYTIAWRPGRATAQRICSDQYVRVMGLGKRSEAVQGKGHFAYSVPWGVELRLYEHFLPC